MLRLALLGLRGRRSAFAGAAVALFAAALLVTACGVLLASGVRGSTPTERYVQAPVVVAGKQTLHHRMSRHESEDVLLPERVRVPSRLAGPLAEVPGVRRAVTDLAVPTKVLGVHGVVPGPEDHDTFAHGWSSAALTPFTLRSGRAPARPGDVVVDDGLARRGGLRVGSRVRLAGVEPAQAATVVGIAAPRSPLRRQAAVFVTDAEAARLAGGAASADAIALVTDRGADTAAVAAAARRIAGPGVSVLTGGDRGAPEFPQDADAREGLVALTATFAGLALVVAMFVIAGTLGLAIQLREREIALLRAVAATPRQVRRMLRWEAIVLALAASAAAYLPGVALAHAMIDGFAQHGLAPEGLAVSGGPLPAIVAVAATLLAALAAAWAGSRRASRVAPTRALQDAAGAPRLIGPLRLLTGLLAIGGGIAVLAVAATADDQDTALAASFSGSLVLVVAAAALGPIVARMAAALPGALVARLSPVGGFLATAATRTAPRRVASAMTPLVLMVAMAATLLFTGTTQDAEMSKQARERQVADLVLTGEAGVPDAAVTEARRTPGVAAAVGIAPTSVLPLSFRGQGSGYVSEAAQTIDGEGAARVLDLDVRSGSLADLHGATVAIGTQPATSAGVEVGDRVTLALGDGTRVRVRVVATYARGVGFGEFVLPRALALPHTTSRSADAVLVRTAPGASRARVAAELRKVAAAHPGLHVGGRVALHSGEALKRDMLRWANRVLAVLILVFTAIAAVNTLAMIALSRGRELALLRLVGATPRQLARMARWEAGLVVIVGIGLGSVIAAAALAPVSRALTGSSMPHVDPALLAGLLGLAAALGVAASLLPTRLALRTRPADAIGLKE